MSEVRVYDAPSDLVGRWVREADMQALRAENARLRKALETVSFHLAQPGDDETPANQYVPSAAEVGTCQVLILAALQPERGKRG